MKPSPVSTNLIDIHSHHNVAEDGVFRIYNYFAGELRQGMDIGPSSIGLHPWHINETELYAGLYQQLYNFAVWPQILAIGEAGFDRHIRIDTSRQEDVFSMQVKLAEDLEKPMIIHCVKAFDLLLNVREKLKVRMPWIIHGFQGNAELAEQLTGKGCYISLSERLLRAPEKASTLIASLSLNHIFIESDEDNLTVRDIYQRIAGIRNIGFEELVEIIYLNYMRVFNPSATPRL